MWLFGQLKVEQTDVCECFGDNGVIVAGMP